MKPSAKKSNSNIQDIEKKIYELKVYAKDMFLSIIDKLDKLESQVIKIKSENVKKGTKSVENNVSLLGDYIEKGTATNRKYKSEDDAGNESHVKKKKISTKNETQIINEKLKNFNEDSDDIKIINKDNGSCEKNKEIKSKKEKKKNDESKKQIEKIDEKSKKEKKKNDKTKKQIKNDDDKVQKKNDEPTTIIKDQKNVDSHKKVDEESEKSNKKIKAKISVDFNVNTPTKLKDQSLTTANSNLITTEFSFKGKYTDRTYDLIKMKERFIRYFKDNWFTVPSSSKLFFNSKQRPPTDEWIAALDCMYEKKMIDRNEGDKLKYKVIE